MSDLDWIDSYKIDPAIQKERETSRMTTSPGSVTIVSDSETKRIERKTDASAALSGNLPKPGQSIHFITNARYDFWMVVRCAIEIIGKVKYFYGSTWTMNRENVQELLTLYDDGTIENISMLTGLYFKRRESAVYAQLLAGLEERGQRFNSFRNHAKVILLQSGDDYIVMEGSANFTANPRLENFCIINDKKLYDFHKEWMEEMLEVEGAKTI